MSSKVFKQVIIKTMKKKIIIASATVLFAVATVFNMNLLQGNSVGDVSLDAIAVMAQAQGEQSGGGGGGESICIQIVVQIAADYTWFKVSCRETLYPDSSAPGCACGSSDITIYLS